MAKKSNTPNIDAVIKDCFTTNTEAKKLHVTSDGQCFLEGSLSAAERHSRMSKVDLKTVNREDYVADVKNIKETVAEVIVDAVNSVEKIDVATDATDLDPKYGKMKLDELKAACTGREIAFDDASAKRKDLILLLEEADAAK